MKVVFMEEVEGTARVGEVKNVADGFARNYLLPRRLAAPATDHYITIAAARAKKELSRQTKLDEEAQEHLVPKMEGQSVTIEMRGDETSVEMVFLDCADEILEKRYRETRRVHPLSPTSVVDGIARERSLLADVAALADFRVDTSSLNVHQLRETVTQYVSGRQRTTAVNVMSFGFRNGTPQSAELLFDLRFLPNPYWDDHLRGLTGEDEAVASFVLDSEKGREFFGRLRDFVGYLLPHYDEEGKAYLTIGLGCTGGQHRSVAVAVALAKALGEQGREVHLEHRDKPR